MPYQKHFTFNVYLLAHALSTVSFLCEGSHLLPSQLPGDHTDHEAASRHSEPIQNAHYSSTHHQCWYSFYLPTRGWRVESTPSQFELGVGIESWTICQDSSVGRGADHCVTGPRFNTCSQLNLGRG